jgi:hypothetical protein
MFIASIVVNYFIWLPKVDHKKGKIMKQKTIQGLENASAVQKDFIMTLNKNKQDKKQFFLSKHNKSIIKVLKPVYDLSIYFITASIFVAGLVELYYA